MARHVRRRQLDEVEMVCCMYPEEAVVETAAVVTRLRSWAAAGGGDGDTPADAPLATAAVRLALTLHDGDTKLTVTMPPRYPDTAAVGVAVGSSAGLPRVALDRVNAALRREAEARVGDEAACTLIGTAVELLGVERDAAVTASSGGGAGGGVGGGRRGDGDTWTADVRGRRVLWFHHIKSDKKKRSIMGWARDLALVGACKPGYPGVVYVEGSDAACTSFVASLKALRWKAIDVRAEVTVAASDATWPTNGFDMLPEGGMCELAERMRAAGLEELFLSSVLKLQKR